MSKKNKKTDDKLIKRTVIEGTPFSVLRKEGKFCGIMGENRLTDWYESEMEAEDEVTKISWERLTQVIMILIEKKEEIDKITKAAEYENPQQTKMNV